MEQAIDTIAPLRRRLPLWLTTRASFGAALCFALWACGGGGSQAPTPGPTPGPGATLTQFGFAAVDCGHDDPFDQSPKTNYTDEVVGFTNLNQFCLALDAATDAARLRDAAATYDPLIYVEPVFLDPQSGQPLPAAQYEANYAALADALAQSKIAGSRIAFYLADEPGLRQIALATLETFALRLKRDFPQSAIFLVEGYSANRDPVVPDFVNVWAFNAYALPDPGAEPLYTGYLDKASTQLRSGQSLAIIGDGIYTNAHQAAGLSRDDMAQVANRYFALADGRKDVSALIVYSWPGGIEPGEEGVRDLPAQVAQSWRAIGDAITAR